MGENLLALTVALIMFVFVPLLASAVLTYGLARLGGGKVGRGGWGVVAFGGIIYIGLSILLDLLNPTDTFNTLEATTATVITALFVFRDLVRRGTFERDVAAVFD